MSSNTPQLHPTSALFRRLAWQSSIPLEIRLADGEPGAGSGADRYYMQAPRHTYLPLLIPEIRENLVEIALDDQQFAETDEKEWWFEEDSERGIGDDGGIEGAFASQGACRWHWPLDLIHLHSLISQLHTPTPKRPSSNLTAPSFFPPSSSSATLAAPAPGATRPLRLLLHLSSPPSDKLMMPNSIEACRIQWLNQVKESDFVRWRNTSRSTGVRKGDFDAGWEGIVSDDFDLHSRLSSRILPLPLAPPQSASSATPVPSRPASTDPAGPRPESVYSARALPVKIYLPDNAPVIHELIPPMVGGKPQTVISALRTYLPLLFPPTSATPYPLAIPFALGVELPPDAEMGWLSVCVCGADGWLRIGIRLIAA